MLALLKLIPVKDWVYTGIIAGLLIGFGAYTLHERHMGAAKIIAADAKTAAAQLTHDKQVETNASNAVQALTAAYNAKLAAPPSPSAPHVIVRYVPSGCAVSGNAGPAISPAAKASVPAESSVDIGPPLDTVGRDADAEVTALQAYIKACQQSGMCKK